MNDKILEENVWYRENNFVYILHQIGWYKGSPSLSNRIWINFNTDVSHGIPAQEGIDAAKLFVEAAEVKDETGMGPKELTKVIKHIQECNLTFIEHNKELQDRIDKLVNIIEMVKKSTNHSTTRIILNKANI